MTGFNCFTPHRRCHAPRSPPANRSEVGKDLRQHIYGGHETRRRRSDPQPFINAPTACEHSERYQFRNFWVIAETRRRRAVVIMSDGSSGAAGAHIVIVDDEPDLRDMLARYLGRHGFDTVAVGGGRALRAHLAQPTAGPGRARPEHAGASTG